MTEIKDGYYFMFEIGWFIDLLIPTLVRVKDGEICLVGSKPCDTKGIKPCYNNSNFFAVSIKTSLKTFHVILL